MADLSIQYAGLHLKNPIMIAAGPWSRNGNAMQKAIDAGAGAVVTETITLDVRHNPSPRLFWQPETRQLFNTTLYSDQHLEQWEHDFERLRRGACKVIASIWASTPSELSYLAAKVERMGADAIEVSVSAPLGTRNQSINNHPREIRAYIHAVKEAVDIPVFVKLSYEAANSQSFTESLTAAQADGVTAIDSLKGLNRVDLELGRVPMGTYGGYSGAAIRPVALATVTTLKQVTDFPICGCGGIQSAENALEFLMLGAGSVQLASVLLHQGYGVIARMVQDLAAWLDRHGYASVRDVVGLALSSLQPFEDILPRPYQVQVSPECDGCGRCVASCLYEALSCPQAGVLSVSSSLCSGCGMCIACCPRNALHLTWGSH